MPRERAQLTDKQERILVQAQLMGLTPRDMQQISNRLIAIQKEAKSKSEIAEAIQDYSWNKDEKDRWTVITPDGYHCEFIKGKNGRSGYYDRTWDYTVKINKPGTAFKTRSLQKQTVIFRDEWIAKLCPEKSKELYGMIVWLNSHLNFILRQK